MTSGKITRSGVASRASCTDTENMTATTMTAAEHQARIEAARDLQRSLGQDPDAGTRCPAGVTDTVSYFIPKAEEARS